jgi:two-component system sensor histidine kinase MtrB
VCIVLAGASAGFLAITSYFIIREYRYRSFEDQATRKVELASLLFPGDTDESTFDETLAEYGQRGAFDAVALVDGAVYSSTPSLGLASVPQEVQSGEQSEVRSVATTVSGQRMLVISSAGDSQRTELYFFFSLADLEASISQFRNVLVVAWLLTVVLASAIGAFVARRVLQPVRAAALSAQALAARLLGDDVGASGDDEFELWVGSYNQLAEALEAKIAELSNAAERERRFTSDVAHELRTPLTALSSTASLLERRMSQLPEEARRPAQLLIGDVRRLQGLVIELLELARLDAGGSPVHLEPLSLDSAVRAVLVSWPERGDMTCRIEPEFAVRADRARFKRVLSNLIDNAVVHGGGHVTIEARRRGRMVDIHVVDDGDGVSVADADRIFERFYKADASRSQRGSGLGLSIALEHARALGGTLRIANPGERGARFVFSLPAAERVTTWQEAPAARLGAATREPALVEDQLPN